MTNTLGAVEPGNTYDQLRHAGGGVAISLNYGGTRQYYVYGYEVWRIGPKGEKIVTDPDASWFNYGKKVFRGEGDNFHARQRDALAKAQAWVAEQGWYNGPWVRNRLRDYVPEEINKRFPIKKR